MIISIFGQSGSGKTTLSDIWKEYHPDYYQIDGDKLRDILPNKDYSTSGRHLNIERANAIATYLNHYGHNVIISMVNPFASFRNDLIRNNPNSVFEVYLTSNRNIKQEYHIARFEVPTSPGVFHLDTSKIPINTMYKLVNESFYHYIKRKCDIDTSS